MGSPCVSEGEIRKVEPGRHTPGKASYNYIDVAWFVGGMAALSCRIYPSVPHPLQEGHNTISQHTAVTHSCTGCTQSYRVSCA